MKRMLMAAVWIGSSMAAGKDITRTHKVTEKYVAVPGGKVRALYLCTPGTENSKPLVCLQGGPGSSCAMLLEALDALCIQERPLLMYDPLGTGLSTVDREVPSSFWTLERAVDELDHVFTAFDIQDCYLWGVSWGASLAASYAVAHPKKISALILASPLLSTQLWKRDTQALLAQLPQEYQDAIRLHEAQGTYDDPAYQAAAGYYMDQFCTRFLQGGFSFTTRNSTGLAGGVTFSLAIYQAMWGPSEFTSLGTLKDFDVIPGLNQLRMPLLIMIGAYDQMSPATVAEITNADIRIFEKSSHCIWVEQSQEHAKALSEFLNENGNSSSVNKTVEFYDRTGQAGKINDSHLTTMYQLFADNLPVHACVLDAGCGAGPATQRFLERGYQVTAFDASKTMATLAEKLTGLPVLVTTFQQCNFPKRHFDGIWASASLLHVPYTQTRMVYEKLHSYLKPNGILFASYKYGNSCVSTPERDFFNMDEAMIVPYLEGLFDIVLVEKVVDTRTQGSTAFWLHLLLKKREITTC